MNHLSFSDLTHMSSFTTIMAPVTNLHGAVSKTLIPITCHLPNAHKSITKRGQVIGFLGSKAQKEASECQVQATRRAAALGLATVVLTWQFNDKVSLAKDNGFWYEDHPLPGPTVTNSKLSCMHIHIVTWQKKCVEIWISLLSYFIDDVLLLIGIMNSIFGFAPLKCASCTSKDKGRYNIY